MELLTKTFTSGAVLTAQELNDIITSINTLIGLVNANASAIDDLEEFQSETEGTLDALDERIDALENPSSETPSGGGTSGGTESGGTTEGGDNTSGGTDDTPSSTPEETVTETVQSTTSDNEEAVLLNN